MPSMQGFIALQLERAANEEVSQNYHGAGVFLSPGKTLDTQGVRARVAQVNPVPYTIFGGLYTVLSGLNTYYPGFIRVIRVL
jgi:hypothetical protein